MDRKGKLIQKANYDVGENIELLRKMHKRWGRCFALVGSNGVLRKVKPTKRGVESELEKLRNTTYISDFTNEQVNCGAGLEIVKVEKEDLLDLDSKELWYRTLWQVHKSPYDSPNLDYYMHIVEKHELGGEIKRFIEKKVEEINNGEFEIEERCHEEL